MQFRQDNIDVGLTICINFFLVQRVSEAERGEEEITLEV